MYHRKRCDKGECARFELESALRAILERLEYWAAERDVDVKNIAQRALGLPETVE